MAIAQKLSIQQFEVFVNHPDQRDRHFELIDGEIVEVPSNTYASEIAVQIAFLLMSFLRLNQVPYRVTGEAGGYQIGGQVFAPDVALTESTTKEGFNPHPPLLAVEVLSDPSDSEEQTALRRKLSYYLRAGVRVWVVDFHTRKVEIHKPDDMVVVLSEEDTLAEPDLLPDFAVTVRDLFPAVSE